MKQTQKSIELGKKDAQAFIENERIDYKPFVAMSDMHMVRKTFSADYAALKTTVDTLDGELWQQIDDSVATLEKTHGETFSRDDYALGFVEGIANVWDVIKDKVRP